MSTKEKGMDVRTERFLRNRLEYNRHLHRLSMLELRYFVKPAKRLLRRRIRISTHNGRDSELVCSGFRKKDEIWAEPNDNRGHDIWYPIGLWFRFRFRGEKSIISAAMIMMFPIIVLVLSLMAILFGGLFGGVVSVIILVVTIIGLWHVFQRWLRMEEFTMNDIIHKFIIGLLFGGILSIMWYFFLGFTPNLLEIASSLWVFVASNAIWIAFIETDKYYLRKEDLVTKLSVMEPSEVANILDEEIRKDHKWW